MTGFVFRHITWLGKSHCWPIEGYLNSAALHNGINCTLLFITGCIKIRYGYPGIIIIGRYQSKRTEKAVEISSGLRWVFIKTWIDVSDIKISAICRKALLLGRYQLRQ